MRFGVGVATSRTPRKGEDRVESVDLKQTQTHHKIYQNNGPDPGTSQPIVSKIMSLERQAYFLIYLCFRTYLNMPSVEAQTAGLRALDQRLRVADFLGLKQNIPRPFCPELFFLEPSI
jgi:hypothetical protein